jgi:hypothetical protein
MTSNKNRPPGVREGGLIENAKILFPFADEFSDIQPQSYLMGVKYIK